MDPGAGRQIFTVCTGGDSAEVSSTEVSVRDSDFIAEESGACREDHLRAAQVGIARKARFVTESRRTPRLKRPIEQYVADLVLPMSNSCPQLFMKLAKASHPISRTRGIPQLFEPNSIKATSRYASGYE